MIFNPIILIISLNYDGFFWDGVLYCTVHICSYMYICMCAYTNVHMYSMHISDSVAAYITVKDISNRLFLSVSRGFCLNFVQQPCTSNSG
jgi:hypothetical protein